MNKTTEALLARIEKLEATNKLAEEALEDAYRRDEHAAARWVYEQAIAAIREAQAEPVQEPVAWVNAERNTITWEKIYPNMEPLYAAPVSAEAIRAEALEYAAYICDGIARDDSGFVAEDCANAIRSLK